MLWPEWRNGRRAGLKIRLFFRPFFLVVNGFTATATTYVLVATGHEWSHLVAKGESLCAHLARAQVAQTRWILTLIGERATAAREK